MSAPSSKLTSNELSVNFIFRRHLTTSGERAKLDLYLGSKVVTLSGGHVDVESIYIPKYCKMYACANITHLFNKKPQKNHEYSRKFEKAKKTSTKTSNKEHRANS